MPFVIVVNLGNGERFYSSVATKLLSIFGVRVHQDLTDHDFFVHLLYSIPFCSLLHAVL